MKRFLSWVVAGALIAPATAIAQSKSIAGTWNATVKTPNGGGAPTLTFIVKGDSVTGTVKRPNGDVAPLRGTIKGNNLTYTYTISNNGQDIATTVKAKVKGDSLSGTMDFAGQMTGEIKAARARKP
jgi:uncharacterized repeat protein (TIGR01451 family)